jgi:hypothetical protein
VYFSQFSFHIFVVSNFEKYVFSHLSILSSFYFHTLDFTSMFFTSLYFHICMFDIVFVLSPLLFCRLPPPPRQCPLRLSRECRADARGRELLNTAFPSHLQMIRTIQYTIYKYTNTNAVLHNTKANIVQIQIQHNTINTIQYSTNTTQ